MALGGEANTMRKQAKEWGQKPGPERFGFVVMILIAVGLVLMMASFHHEDRHATIQTTSPSTTEEHSLTTEEYEIDVDEKGIPTPDSLEQLEESQAMKEYYREQRDEAQKQLMQEQEPNDGFQNQPY